MKNKHAITASAIALAASLFMALPFARGLHTFTIDSLFLLRHQLQQNFPGLHRPAPPSEVAVIAIDEETYQHDSFRELPKVMWSRQYADVLDATIKGGAAVVGFDIVLPTSVEKFIPRYDIDFRKSLYEHSRKGKVVLGKVQHHGAPVAPHPSQSFAVGHEKNIRLLNLGSSADSGDGVVRYLPLWFNQTDRLDTSMAVELAARKLGTKITPKTAQPVVIGDYTVPTTHDNAMLINFNTRPGYIPTYSLADLYGCSEKKDADYFTRHFEGKVVLVGAVLGLEDRKKAASRYTNTKEGQSTPERCAIEYDAGKYVSSAVRDDISGVYIHAHAINSLLQGNALRELGKFEYAALSLPLSLLIAFLTISLSASRLALASLASSLLWVGIVLTAFYSGLVLPLFGPLAAAALTFAAVLGFRFAITDKDKRLIKKAFGLYLEPAVIDTMMRTGNTPSLGGEIRVLTVWFSDIANFTSISEKLSPAALVEFLNQYFDVMTSIVKQHDGFVDKFVGDAIIAVFGAPHDDPQHALHAVQSALACDRRLLELKGKFGLPDNIEVAARIGINTGEMLVGNIGATNRLNYTIMGDEVNLAARLEGVNKVYGTTVIASDSTVARCRDEIQFRELDMVRVKGREAPLTIYEPLHDDAVDAERLEAFAQALQHWRDADFSGARERFTLLANQGDAASARFVLRAEQMLANPPPSGWDKVNTLDSK